MPDFYDSTRPGVGVAASPEPQRGANQARRWRTPEEAQRAQQVQQMIGEALQGVPADVLVIQESTANGSGGYFYDAWNEASDNPDGIWLPIFLKWWHMAEYSLPVLAPMDLTEEEVQLKRSIPELTQGNLLWRREKIKELGGSRVDVETGLSGEMLFRQNYPMTPAESFLGPC